MSIRSSQLKVFKSVIFILNIVIVLSVTERDILIYLFILQISLFLHAVLLVVFDFMDFEAMLLET